MEKSKRFNSSVAGMSNSKIFVVVTLVHLPLIFTPVNFVKFPFFISYLNIVPAYGWHNKQLKIFLFERHDIRKKLSCTTYVHCTFYMLITYYCFLLDFIAKIEHVIRKDTLIRLMKIEDAF